MTATAVPSAPETPTPTRPPRRRPTSPGDRFRTAAFLFPAVGTIAVVLIAPFVFTIYRSLFDDSIAQSFAGWDNYTQVFTNPVLRQSLLNTLMWVVGSLALPVVLGLTIAVMTSESGFGRLARLAVVLPYAMSGTVVAVVGSFMLRTDGAVNQALGALGLEGLQRDWLLTWPSNTISAILFSTWQSTGVAVVLFLVGLQTVPKETLEAAALDGATGWRRFRFVVFPQLRAVTVVVVGITLANALKTFDLIYVLTSGGGPGRSSETLALSMFRETFVLNNAGVGSATAVVLTVIVLGASWIYLRPQLRETQ